MSQILLLLMKQIFSPPEQNTVQQLFLRNNLEEKARETLVHYIFDSEVQLFKNLLQNYLVKFEILSKKITNYNSSYYCGIMINLLLKNCEKYKEAYPDSVKALATESSEHITLLFRLIMDSYKDINQSVQIQKI